MEDTPLQESSLARQQLATMLFQCFNALNVYGKEPEQLTDSVAMFQRILARFSLRQIQAAFDQYLSRNSQMPAPADIVNIIDPPPQPLSATTYITIKKKLRDGNVFVTDEEYAYIKEFDRREVAKVAGGSDAYREAQAELDADMKQRLALVNDT